MNIRGSRVLRCILMLLLAVTLCSESYAGKYKITYVHNDHLGRPVAGTDEAGRLRWEVAYTPFGEATAHTGNVPEYIGFPGQYADTAAGPVYNYQRWYDPNTGRYLTSDPIGLEGGLNTYVYALGNPIRYTDPRGELVPWAVAGLVVAGLTIADLMIEPTLPAGHEGDAIAPSAGPFDLLGGAAVGVRSCTALFARNLPKLMRSKTLWHFGRSMDDLTAAAANPINKEGLTAAARALTKHASGQRSTGTFPMLKGGIPEQNESARGVVESILRDPASTFTKLRRGGLEVRSTDGRGLRFNSDGTFSGFVDPKL